MKTLRNLDIVGGLFRGSTTELADIGDIIILYLDTEANENFPESITGTITAVASIKCGNSISYSVEYDETPLGVLTLRPGDVVDYFVESNDTAYIAADVVVTNAFIAADAAITAAYIAADALNAPLEHTHVSSDVTDATASSTAEVLVLRDATGISAFDGLRIDNEVSGPFAGTYFLLRQTGDSIRFVTYSALGVISNVLSFLQNSSGFTVGFSASALTANRAYALPNANGIVALTANTAGIPDQITVAGALTALGIPTYADLATANAALAIGQPYYDTALAKLQITTA